MRVLRARHMGMCFGVRDAIALAVRESASRPLTVLGELVHNETVLDDLRARGIRFCGDVGRGGHAVRDDHRTRRVRTPPRDRSRSRSRRARRHLLPGPHRALRRDDDGAGGPSSGRRRPAGPRGGARAHRGPRGVRRGAGRRGRAPPDAARPVRRRRPDDAARREGPASGVAHPAAVSRRRGAGGRTRCAHRHSGAKQAAWELARARRRRHRHRRRPQQQHPRTRGHVPRSLRARLPRADRGGPAGRVVAWAPAWSVSRRAPPRRTGSSTMSRRGCGRSPPAGWRRRLGRG